MILSLIIAFGTFVAITVGSSRLQNLLRIKSILSAYAAEIVDTKGAVGIEEDAMLADNHIINLENRDGSNTMYLFSEPISYTDENGELKTKDISVEKQNDSKLKSAGYEYTNGQNDYRINFSSDIQKGVMIEFNDCGYSIIPQTDYTSSVGKKSTSVYLNDRFEIFEYSGAFGAQTVLKFYPQLNGLKDEIVLNQNINKNTFSFALKTDNCKAVLNDDGTVSLISNEDESSVVQTFSKPFAYDSEYVEGDRDEHYTDCTYTLEQLDDYTYIMSVTVDKSWLDSEATVYPVTIDPTTSNLANYKDAGIYSSATSRVIPYGNEATCCFGRTSNSEFGYGRVLNYFSWPEEIKKGAKINSAYIWERETTGRTSTTYVAPCLVKDHWVESSVTWENRPDYYPATTMARKNINSKSTDKSGDPYWYKFDITSAVQYWTDGTYHNYGLLFRSSEEDDGNYNWRAFASKQHSTSSYRPYTVINYTNDTVAPTINSVTGNPTAWTNGNVTLTINGAADNSGGSGLHSTPYSFSTTKGSYAWQSGNTKTFSSNCTVYIYVRDAMGNIRLVSTQTINKIDKTAPSVPTVTGNATEWTSGSVTLTANSTDSQSGIAAYSFSTVKGSYSWQTGKTKTVAENTTLYVYSKDNAGNISQPMVVDINKIDKNAPEIPTVTGNTDSWTNNNIVLTAQADDDLSGVAAYSFSYESDQHNWQTDNTFEADKQSKIYVCAKDNAGNISDVCELDLKIDKLSPTGSISAQNPTDWVRNVTITADASDEISGLHEMPYSFSSSEDSYNWQASNQKVITINGTYYIYARDAAENIILLDTFTVDKIDSLTPVISDVQIENADDSTIITVTASDSQSGIAAYSIDNGQTWQDSNILEIEKDSKNYIDIKVKDNVGNVASRRHVFYTPQMYIENDKLCLYSPNPMADDNTIYYSFKNIGGTVKYEKPMDLVDCRSRIYMAFYKTFGRSNPLTIDYKEPNRFSYSESNVDLSLSYNSVRFDIARKYADGEWSYSFDNVLEMNDNGALIRVRMPDLNTYYFVKQSKYLYVSQNYDYELSVVYDDKDSNIVEYIVKCNDVFYHYSPDGKLAEISSKYGTAFSFTYTNDYIKIHDGAGRITLLSFENEWLKVTDASGAVISYLFDDEKLLRVTDQAGVIIAEYAYTDGKISKSMDKSIFYDSDGRVTQYLYDNGYSIKFEYGKDSVTTASSDGKTSTVTYDKYYNILSSTDNFGEITTYTYDKKNLVKVEKSGEIVAEYSYTANGNLSKKTESGETYSYYYDDKNRLEKVYHDNKYTAYQYDDDDNIISTGEFNYVTFYTPAINYTYENGLLVKIEDVDSKTETSYNYDSSGRVIKTTTAVTAEDGTVTTTTTDNLYDEYGNLAKVTSTKEENGEISIAVTDNTYDITGRLLSTSSGDSETSYVYDAAGRTLLVHSDEDYSRTVYDNYGRTV